MQKIPPIISSLLGTKSLVPSINTAQTVVSGKGVKPSSTVTVYKNGSSVGTATANGSGVWSYTFSAALTPGDIVTYDAVLTSVSYITPPVIVLTGGNVGMTATQLLPGRVYQRLSSTGGLYGKGFGTITCPIVLTAAAQIVEYRVRDADAPSTTIKDWSTASTNLPINTTSVTCTNIPANAKRYFIDLRANKDNSQIILGTSAVMMGRVIGISGQSLSVRMLGAIGDSTTIASFGVTPGPFGWVNAAYYDNQREGVFGTWQKPADGGEYDSAFIAEYLNRAVGLSGVACGVVGSTVGGVNAAYFAPGGFGYTKLMQALDYAGGAFEHFIWMQGHTDSANGNTSAGYRSDLTNVFTQIATKTNIPFTKVLASIPNISTVGTWGDGNKINTIRAAAAKWCTDNGGIYVQPEDLDLGDGTHQTQLGSFTLARHYYRAERPLFGFTTSDIGPIISSATRADGSKSVVLAITLTSGSTKLVSRGSPATRFTVFQKNTVTNPYALDSTTPIVVGTNTITLNLAADPGNGNGVDVYYGFAPDPSPQGGVSGIFDDAVDGDGITTGRNLTANLAPISTAGAGAAPTPVGPNVNSDNNMTYTTSPGSFGKQRISGSGHTDTAVSPLNGTNGIYTVECRIMVPQAPGATIVFVGQNNALWIGANGSGQLLVNNGADYIGTSTPGADGNNPVITDGVLHHLQYVATGTKSIVFLDGNIVATNNNKPPSFGQTGNAFGIGGLGGSGFSPPNTTTIDEVAIWNIAKNTVAFTPPTAPYLGTETGLIGLWHLDGNGNSGF